MDKQLTALLAKLSKPYWMPTDPRLLVKNLTPDHMGQLNIMWVLTHRLPITQGFFDKNLAQWDIAGRVCSERAQGATVREFATLYTEAEFYPLILAHRKVFTKHLAMRDWQKLFRAPKTDKGRHA